MSHPLHPSSRAGWLRKLVDSPSRTAPRSVEAIYAAHEAEPDKKDVKEGKEQKDGKDSKQ